MSSFCGGGELTGSVGLADGVTGADGATDVDGDWATEGASGIGSMSQVSLNRGFWFRCFRQSEKGLNEITRSDHPIVSCKSALLVLARRSIPLQLEKGRVERTLKS